MRRHRILTLAWICMLTMYTPAATQNPRVTTALSYIERGDEWFAKGEYERAYADYDLAVASAPALAEAYYKRASARAQKRDLAGALADYDRALLLNPRFSWALIGRAMTHGINEDFDGAIRDSNKAIEIDSRLAEAWGVRGAARIGKKDFAGALADLNRALKLKPMLAQAWTDRGAAKYFLGDFTGAIDDHTQSMKRRPNHAEAYNDRGAARQANGDVPGALTDYNRALELNPAFASAYFNRAQVWREGGGWARALATVKGDVNGITQIERGPYARIAILRPHDGRTVDFEAGYIRHLDWHRQAKDTRIWYGWNIWAGERQRWFVFATFGHSAASLDSSVAPAEDERDNILNVTPHAQFVGNAIYEYLPGLSRGTGEPAPAARLEFTTVDLRPGTAKAFEAALSADQSKLQGETLWYRMVAGGTAPRYVRLRPRHSLSAILDGKSEQALPDKVNEVIAKMTIEILNLQPTMSYGLSPAHR